MNIYLVQHAKAVSREHDPERPLSIEGKEEIDKVAMFLESMNISVGYLWHSKKLRAAETAGELTEAINITEQKAWLDGLSPNDDVKKFKEEKIDTSSKDIMIVGHMPFLSKLASLLLIDSSDREIINFKNAGIVCLSNTNENWQVEWIIIPKLLD